MASQGINHALIVLRRMVEIQSIFPNRPNVRHRRYSPFVEKETYFTEPQRHFVPATG
jgi:hypothetical protein